MRQIIDTRRKKMVFNISLSELKKGDWLEQLPDSELVEFSYKNNYLTICDATIRKMKSEKEGKDDGRGNNKGKNRED